MSGAPDFYSGLTGPDQPYLRRAYSTAITKRVLAEAPISDYVHSMNFNQRITISPDKRSGQPCIRGMRITVKDILEYLAGGMTQEQILEDFPELEPEDFIACFAFAAHRESHLELAVAS